MAGAPGLVPCKVCGRTFLPARILKHQQVCALATTSRRRVFNTAKQRLSGLDSADRGLVQPHTIVLPF